MSRIHMLFLQVLELTMEGSIAICFVLLARLLLKKAPKIFSYALWAIVLVRLLIPVSIQSPVSAIPELPEVSDYHLNHTLPVIEMEAPLIRQETIVTPPSTQIVSPSVPQKTVLEPVQYLAFGWMTGVGVMALSSLISYRKLKRKLRVSIPLEHETYLADDIPGPFVIGLFRPRIYLPANLGEAEQAYILLHERYHIRRLDHWAKAIGFLALTVHWFNPLVWLAFALFSRDMEMSCDEAVIRRSGAHIRGDYSASLLTLATGKRIIAGTPLAFGEGDPRGRIRNLANWKRPAFRVILIALALCLLLAVCLLTDPVSQWVSDDGVSWYYGTVVEYGYSNVNEQDAPRFHILLRCLDGNDRKLWAEDIAEVPEDIVGQFVMVRSVTEYDTGLNVFTDLHITDPETTDSLAETVRNSIIAYNSGKYYEGECKTAAFKELSRKVHGDYFTLWGIARYAEFDLEDGMLKDVSGSMCPVVLTMHMSDDDKYTLAEYWMPRDGEYYAKDIRKKFRGQPWPDGEKYALELDETCYLMAMRHFQVDDNVLIHTLLQEICDSSRWHPEFSALIEASSREIDMLTHNGYDTLNYCFTRFLEQSNDDLYGQVMAYVCNEIMKVMGEPPLPDWDFNRSGQDWFASLAARARQLSTSSDYEAYASFPEEYPVSYLLLSMTPDGQSAAEWGLSFALEDVTPSGVTLVISQSGGYPTGQLMYGQPFFLHRQEEGQWVSLEPKLEAWGWTMEAYVISLNTTHRFPVNWEWLYGKLPAGHYRFGKTISNFRANGDYDEALVYLEFDIP